MSQENRWREPMLAALVEAMAALATNDVPIGAVVVDDLGMHAMDMGVLLDDDDLYPDEMLSDVARALGFGELFDDLVGLTSSA